jgi:low affinity Fe/Cu permease
MVQKNVYSRFATPPPIFIVATVLVFVWLTFCMLSVVAELEAVVRVCPEARVVSVL